MKKPLQSIFWLLAPCLALMAMAFYLTRRAAVAPQATIKMVGPLQVSIAGVEARKVTPDNVYDGYDHRLDMVFAATGKRPPAWGTDVTTRSGTSNQTWKFWLERNGKRTPWKPGKNQVWTSDWDKKKKRYFNQILIHSGSVPDDAALKMSGTSQIFVYGSAVGPGKFGAPLPFELTLKKAGQKWRAPQVSTDPGVTVQKIEIQKPVKGETTASVTLLLAPGVEMQGETHNSLNFLNPDWSAASSQTGFGGGMVDYAKEVSGSTRRHYYQIMWSTADVPKLPQRDLIASYIFSSVGQWPLEIAFPVKKDGQPLYGVVPALTRPRGKAAP